MMAAKPLSLPTFLPRPRIQPKRLRWRMPMTIAAGFVCSDGLVLFADTEEQEGYMKTEVEKIQIYPGSNCSLLITNAGQGYLADSLIDRIFDEIETTTADEAAIISKIRETILKFHREEVGLYPADNEHKQVGLILGLQVDERAAILLHSAATALRKVKQFAVIGFGAEIKFLAQQMYQKGMPIKHGILIATHLLKTAIEHVQGCGGQSRIGTLSDGGAQMRHIYDVWGDQRLFSYLQANYRAVLLSIPDEDITDEQYDNCLGWFVEEAWKARSEMLSTREFNKDVKQKHAEYRAERGEFNFDNKYYSPIPDTLSHSDRRRSLPKYQSRVLSLKRSISQTTVEKK
jgi:hypothetical protein